MAGVKISNLPAGGAITGPELVPVVQGGTTVRTTASAIVSGGLGFTPVNRAGDTMTGTLNYAATQSIASAATVGLGASTSNVVIITGTTTITAFSSVAAGAVRYVTFAGVLTLTHNGTSLILPSAANITTAPGDTAIFVSLGSGNWRCLQYSLASGLPVVAPTPPVPPAPYRRNLFTTSGSWTCPAGVTRVYITASAGGGGGAGSVTGNESGGGGGGGSAILKEEFTVVPTTIYTVTVGAGGAAGLAGGAGGNGGTTTIPSLFSLAGGTGGSLVTGGNGGTNAMRGSDGTVIGTDGPRGGLGGGNIAGGVGGSGPGLRGGGGGGASSYVFQAGQAGGAGFVLIEY